MLKALEKGEVELPSLSSKLFFDLLWRNTEEGFFADPIYGGNRDKVGWKLIGFPGVPSGAYKDAPRQARAVPRRAGEHSRHPDRSRRRSMRRASRSTS